MRAMRPLTGWVALVVAGSRLKVKERSSDQPGNTGSA